MLKVIAIDNNGNQYSLPEGNDIPDYIAKGREKSGLSMQALAEKLGVKRQTVWLWENGTSLPTIDNLTKVVEVFNILGAEPAVTEADVSLEKVEKILGVP